MQLLLYQHMMVLHGVVCQTLNRLWPQNFVAQQCTDVSPPSRMLISNLIVTVLDIMAFFLTQLCFPMC
jgi:hypothetical protein